MGDHDFRHAFGLPGTTQSIGHRPPIDIPQCSPCNLMFTSDALDPSADIPYDTQRCDSECVGKYGTALRRLAGNAAQSVQRATGHDDVIVSLWLVSRGTEYRFELSNHHGTYSWRGGDATSAAKDGQLRATITVGARGGLRQFPVRQPPPMQLAPGLQLSPHARSIGGQRILTYESDPTPVHVFSKHREMRGDAPEQWAHYRDPDTMLDWEYMSGQHSKRLARWKGGRAIDIDAEAHHA